MYEISKTIREKKHSNDSGRPGSGVVKRSQSRVKSPLVVLEVQVLLVIHLWHPLVCFLSCKTCQKSEWTWWFISRGDILSTHTNHTIVPVTLAVRLLWQIAVYPNCKHPGFYDRFRPFVEKLCQGSQVISLFRWYGSKRKLSFGASSCWKRATFIPLFLIDMSHRELPFWFRSN